MDFDSLPNDVPAAASTPSPASATPAAGANFDALQDDEQKYGGVGGESLAALAGLARGASLGTSDLALVKSGLVKPETLKGLSSTNPLSSFTGNLVGAAGLIGATGGLAAPLEGAAATAEVAGSGLLGAGLSQTAARAVGYGAEGALFGAGNAVSDSALGDQKLTAGKLLTDGALGGLFGAGVGAISGSIASRIAEKAEATNLAAQTKSALQGVESSAPGATGSAVDPATEGFVKLKPIAKDLARDAQQEGLPLPFAFISANKNDQNLYNMLVDTAPSFSGVAAQNELASGVEKVQNNLANILDTGDTYGGGVLTKADLGNALTESLVGKSQAQSAPVENLYNALTERTPSIPVDSSSVSSAIKTIEALPNLKYKGADAALANQVLKILPTLETAEEVRGYIPSLRGNLPTLASGNEKHMVGVLSDLLNNVFESSVSKAAGDVPELGSLVAENEAAKKAAQGFKQIWNPVIEQLGGKTGYGYGAKYNESFLRDLDPEKLADKLFDAKYANFNHSFSENFPEEAGLIRQFQKQKLKTAALNSDGTIDPKAVFNKVFGYKNIKGMEPEVASAIFGEDELASMKRMNNWIRNIPGSANPSRTDYTRALRNMFKDPLGAAAQNATDFGIMTYLKARSMLPNALKGNPFVEGAELGQKFNEFQAVKNLEKDVDEKISNTVSSIFTRKDAVRGAALSAGSIGAKKEYDKVAESIQKIAGDPNGGIDQMVAQTAPLEKNLPGIVQGIHQAATQGAMFLASKLPRSPGNFPLNHQYEPSDAEKAKFMRYYHAVNDPVSVLDGVKHGAVSNESMEALQAVHPDLLDYMRKELTSGIQTAKVPSVPVGVRLAMGKFLGTPLNQSMTPAAIQSNQAALAGPQLGSQKAAPTSGRRGSMKALNPAERVATATRRGEPGDE